jgi:hypothetical protein
MHSVNVEHGTGVGVGVGAGDGRGVGAGVGPGVGAGDGFGVVHHKVPAFGSTERNGCGVSARHKFAGAADEQAQAPSRQ